MWLCGIYFGREFYHGAFHAESLLFVLVFFSVLFGIVITSLGEERAGLCAFRTFVCLFCTHLFLSFFSSSWCQGLAAARDCGTPWTFLLTLFNICIMVSSCFAPVEYGRTQRVMFKTRPIIQG